MTQHVLVTFGWALAVAVAVASCGSTTACAVNSAGVAVCETYAAAYPYDYAYYDPMYASTWAYAPYYVDTYADPAGYAYVYALPARPVPIADPQAGSDVPELLDKANRAANAINAGVRAALDPIGALMKTTPREDGDTVTYGPADHGAGNYQFTMRRLSESEKRFGWRLEARPAGSTGTFTAVAGGLIRVGVQERRGRGAIGVDCSAMAAADTAVTCHGTLLIGFAHTDDGDKMLNVGLRGYTPDMSGHMPIDGKVFAWRDGDAANHVRLVTRTNLSGTATDAAETVALKLTWIKDVGVRADAAATGGDIGPGQVMIVNTCVGPDLNEATAMTAMRTCAADGSGCTDAATPTCGAGLDGEQPNADISATDPPAGMPEMPEAPAAMPDGEGN
jgi:hypothetical protein